MELKISDRYQFIVDPHPISSFFLCNVAVTVDHLTAGRPQLHDSEKCTVVHRLLEVYIPSVTR